MNRMIEKIKRSFVNRKFKYGAYSTAISAVVIIIIIILNLMVGELNLKIDLNKDDRYTLTSQTKDVMRAITEEIKLYYIAGEDSQDTLVKEILDQYDGIEDHIQVEIKDPILYPQFATQYTKEEIQANSVIVVNVTSGRSKVVNYNDMFLTEVDYSTYTEETTGIDVEGQITSALLYVTTQDLPILYQVEGHGELEIPLSLASSLAKENVITEQLSTLTTESIPKDCSVLLINGPQYDFTKQEATMIEEYLKAGGDAIILTSYTTEETPLFDGILSYYGVIVVSGLVIEEDSNFYMSGTPTYLVPSTNTHEITSSILHNKIPVVIPVSKGLQMKESLNSSVTIDPLLTSSDSAFSKVNVNSLAYNKEDGDVNGPFYLGVAITDSNALEETKITVYSSSYLIDESMVSLAGIGNTDLFLNSIKWMSDTKVGLSIPTRSLVPSYLTLNAAQVNLYSGLVVVVIPFIILMIGIVISIKRRRQ